ncbi:MAG: glycoside hydrolase family 16 protein, partial [Cyclobacteriaceae bacterium]
YDGMNLVWQDEFSGSSLNTADWSYEIGDGCPNLCGWGNNELEYYRQENTSVQDGYLTITAKQEAFGGRSYTSSRIKTQGKQNFQYGRIDIRAVLPEGQGVWPALWMLGSNITSVSWPACGEIDIMEMIGGAGGRDRTVHGTIHWDNNGSYANYGGDYSIPSKFSEEFHVFTLIWDENSIEWLVDDVQFHTVDITPDALSEFRNDYFLLFNVAVGGNWPGSPDGSTQFPQSMIVDYVRVFQQQ